MMPTPVNPALWHLARLKIRETHAFRVWIVLGIMQVFLQLIMMRAIWLAVYGSRTSVDGITANTMVTYLTVVGVLNFVIRPNISEEIFQRINQGRIAVDMVKPVGFIWQMLSIEIGWTLGRLPSLIVVIPGLMVIGSLALPDPSLLPAFVLSFILALLVSVQIWLLVGLSGFWFINIAGVRSLVGVIGSFLAGSMIPVWFMPAPLKSLVELLPFQAINYLPASIYTGEASGGQLFHALGIQFGWLVILALVNSSVWLRAQRRIIVQGG